MLRITETKRLYEFQAWSGGKYTLEHLTLTQCFLLEAVLEDWFGTYEKPIEAIDLNDFLWFQRDEIAHILGYADWDYLVEDNKERMGL